MIFSKKQFLKTLFFVCLCLLSNEILAQKKLKKINLSGKWEGRITQNEGGFKTDYSIIMTLEQKGTSITGESYVFVDDMNATMEVKGVLRGGMLFKYEETKIKDFTKLEDMEWCLKNGQLIFKQDGNVLKLEGFWQGASSDGPCIPGEVFLTKVTPRA